MAHAFGGFAEPVELEVENAVADEKIPLFGGRKRARELSEQLSQLGASDLVEVRRQTDEARAAHEQAVAKAAKELASLREEVARTRAELDHLRGEVVDVRDAAVLQEVSLYDFEHPAENSVALGAELAQVRAEIKASVAGGRATRATANFTYNNSAAKGKKFVADLSKMMLAAYNSEAENAVKTVKAGNLPAAVQRLRNIAVRIERYGKMIDLVIQDDYERLRQRELDLTSRHMRALEVEKEAERARRAELREQAKVEAELKRERERLEKQLREEREKVRAAIAKAQASGEATDEFIAQMEARIADTEKAITDLDYRAANLRAGFVYVISNVGAFGERMVKIGMTRRQEPMDRVRELGDASVPFGYDVHALFFSDDAPGTEAMLHRTFAERRVNKINPRREFFYCTPQEVLDVLQGSNVPLVEFTLEPAAEEFRQSGGLITAPNAV
ncbi:MAG: DUF4041 domain-containing protein [Promicromonosporaceae bacterium]|nr:DUF4041 domain-containing protein [Promicromonosporaceae bacterium]